MVKWGGIFCIVILLFAGLAISPAIGSIHEAGEGENVTVYFWDCTGKRPVKQVLELTESEWNDIREQLREIRKTSESIKESFNAQFAIFKQYGLISEDASYESLEEIANERFKNKPHRPPRDPLIDNVIINAICAINFELDSGTTFVFGLNTFINLIGFDIVSFHKGHTPDGIFTLGGLLAQFADPGDYLGFMFGFLGYWFGTKTGTGFYSDLIVAGFTVMTTWLPISSR